MVSFTQIALAAPLLLGVASAVPLPNQDQNLAVRSDAMAEVEVRDISDSLETRGEPEDKKEKKSKSPKKDEEDEDKNKDDSEKKSDTKSHNKHKKSKSTGKHLSSSSKKTAKKDKYELLKKFLRIKGQAKKDKEAWEKAKKEAAAATGSKKAGLLKKAKSLGLTYKKSSERANRATEKAKKMIKAKKAGKEGKKSKKAGSKKAGSDKRASRGLKEPPKKPVQDSKGWKRDEIIEERDDDIMEERDLDDLELAMLARDLDYVHDIDSRDVDAEYELEVRDFDFDADELYI